MDDLVCGRLIFGLTFAIFGVIWLTINKNKIEKKLAYPTIS